MAVGLILWLCKLLIGYVCGFQLEARKMLLTFWPQNTGLLRLGTVAPESPSDSLARTLPILVVTPGPAQGQFFPLPMAAQRLT